MSPKIWILLGAVSAAAAVGFGAFHAHGLEKMLVRAHGFGADELQRRLNEFDVAVRYQMLHAVALILVGLIGMHALSAWLDVAAFCFALGMLLFSGCLETTVMMNVKLPWFLVPAGGSSMIVGWLLLAAGSLRLPMSK